jgi:ferric-dicitrate binding protein FerR (iron transport regulator)
MVNVVGRESAMSDATQGVQVRRRTFLAAAIWTAAAFPERMARASGVIGSVDEVRGKVSRRKGEVLSAIRAGADIMDRDLIVTGEGSFAELTLGEVTKLMLGSRTELLVDSFIAAQGGTIELGTGEMIFDRPDEAPKIDLTVRTAFGMIGVRGTKFFAGPNRGAFAVFVERGLVRFEGGGVVREVGAGQGIDVPPATGIPGEVQQWGEARIREAYASIGVR